MNEQNGIEQKELTDEQVQNICFEAENHNAYPLFKIEGFSERWPSYAKMNKSGLWVCKCHRDFCGGGAYNYYLLFNFLSGIPEGCEPQLNTHWTFFFEIENCKCKTSPGMFSILELSDLRFTNYMYVPGLYYDKNGKALNGFVEKHFETGLKRIFETTH